MSVVSIRPDMLARIMDDPQAAGLPAPAKPERRTFRVGLLPWMGRYHVGQPTLPHCPGCQRQQWLVGRTTAECAFCGTAMPLNG